MSEYRRFLKEIPDENIFTYGDLPYEAKGERIWIECEGLKKATPKRIDPKNRLSHIPSFQNLQNDPATSGAPLLVRTIYTLTAGAGLPISIKQLSKTMVEISVPRDKKLKEELQKLPEHVWEKTGHGQPRNR